MFIRDILTGRVIQEKTVFVSKVYVNAGFLS